MNRYWYGIFNRHLMWHLILLCLGIFACDGSRADIIVSVKGPPNAALFLGGLQNPVDASSWSTTQPYDDVQIDAAIGSLDPNFANGTAFLSTKIGPGTTLGDIVATAPFQAPITTSYNQPVENTTLFQHLSLSPGPYFLTLSGSPAAPD